MENEPILEKWARFFRYSKADSFIAEKLNTSKSITLIDFGCGQDILYYKYLQQIFPSRVFNFKYFGVDPLLNPRLSIKSKKVSLIKKKFEISEIKEKADIITMFAVLEHVIDPAKLLRQAAKALKPDGIMIITTPSPLARFPLEFASHVLGIIAEREINEHQRYPNRKFLLAMNHELKTLSFEHEYFELGLNNLLVVRKTKGKPLPFYSFTADLTLILHVIIRAFHWISN